MIIARHTLNKYSTANKVYGCTKHWVDSVLNCNFPSNPFTAINTYTPTTSITAIKLKYAI